MSRAFVHHIKFGQGHLDIEEHEHEDDLSGLMLSRLSEESIKIRLICWFILLFIDNVNLIKQAGLSHKPDQ